MLIKLLPLLITFLLLGCSPNQSNDPFSHELGVVDGFSELINAGVKQLALSSPLDPSQMDEFIIEAEKVASKYKVSIYRESDLIQTDMFPTEIAAGKEVLLLFQGTTLDEYLTLKKDKELLENSGKYKDNARLEIARRFGRMLSYSPRKINKLLSENTSFRTMDDFGIRANNLFLYYKDLKKATEFYSKTLGMEIVADYKMAVLLRMSRDSYLILVDATKGMHTAEEPKTVALALLTDQLDKWYDYLQGQGVEIKYKYRPKEGSAHDGFVAVDPEGYLLEFETFHQHQENEKFIPLLDLNKKEKITADQSSMVPEELYLYSTITWLYYKDLLSMQHYFQDVLGLEMVADQGWTKIYKVSDTGFIGLVDERRGMHNYSETKAVNVGFILDDVEAWFDYAKKNQVMELHEEELGIGPETRYKAFVGYDPGNYYLEFDRFFPHEDNKLLLEYLAE